MSQIQILIGCRYEYQQRHQNWDDVKDFTVTVESNNVTIIPVIYYTFDQ